MFIIEITNKYGDQIIKVIMYDLKDLHEDDEFVFVPIEEDYAWIRKEDIGNIKIHEIKES